MTEAEARAALRGFLGAGHVEPWIAQQAWEATPSGWTVPVPLDGSTFGVVGTVTPLIDLWVEERRLPAYHRAVGATDA